MTENVSLPERLDATFLKSAPDRDQCPDDQVVEVAFAGRSNAGKSSVLNTICGSRRMAKVSKTPGRTRLLNLFDLKRGGRLVDLPGYGYAKASKSSQAEWQKSVNDYLSLRDNLVGVVLVTDIRHPDQAYDEELIEWSRASELPIHVLLNKADKLGQTGQSKAIRQFTKRQEEHDFLTFQTFSALKGRGKVSLIQKVCSWVDNANPGDAQHEPQDDS